MSSEPVSPAPRALGWDGGIFPGLTPRAMGDHPIRGLLSRVSWGVAGVPARRVDDAGLGGFCGRGGGREVAGRPIRGGGGGGEGGWAYTL